eukprot:NODE_397_length_9427_cov_0.309605.p6 type:complete len:146 gc:universal NODE_397_length_9427_cov_0.309605:5020-4583(-)
MHCANTGIIPSKTDIVYAISRVHLPRLAALESCFLRIMARGEPQPMCRIAIIGAGVDFLHLLRFFCVVVELCKCLSFLAISTVNGLSLAMIETMWNTKLTRSIVFLSKSFIANLYAFLYNFKTFPDFSYSLNTRCSSFSQMVNQI